MPNNAELGITIQKLICDKYNLQPHQNAVKQFDANYNREYKDDADIVIDRLFEEINLKPIDCLTYAPSMKTGETPPRKVRLYQVYGFSCPQALTDSLS